MALVKKLKPTQCTMKYQCSIVPRMNWALNSESKTRPLSTRTTPIQHITPHLTAKMRIMIFHIIMRLNQIIPLKMLTESKIQMVNIQEKLSMTQRVRVMNQHPQTWSQMSSIRLKISLDHPLMISSSKVPRMKGLQLFATSLTISGLKPTEPLN